MVWIFRGYALKSGLLDTPNERSSHQVPTPRGGGIVFVFLWFFILGAGFQYHWLSFRDLLIFLPGTLMVSLLGYWDDHRSLSAKKRFIIQILAAVICVYQMGDVSALHLFSKETFYLGSLGIGIAILGLVWSTNLFNFMDGLDGLAGTEALFVLGVGGGLYASFGFTEVALLIWALTVTIAGFLVWNWPKARVFMGDAGSYCLGFLIALFAIVGDIGCGIPIILWLILYAVFWFDATVTLLRRFFRGDQIATAHRDHAYQRLHRAGFSHQQVLFCIIALNCLLVGIVAWVTYRPQLMMVGFWVAIGILSTAYGLVEKIKPMERKMKC